MPPLPILERFQRELLQSDAIIPVVNHSSSLSVPTSVLRSMSGAFAQDINTAMIEQNALLEEHVVLKYLDDDPQAWTLLLYWAHHHRLPPKEHWNGEDELLIDAWILGHTHEIPAFQDDVMIELLHMQCCMELGNISIAFAKTLEDSPLCRVLVEEVVYQLRVHKVMDICELDYLAQTCGFTGAFAMAMERYGREGKAMFERFPEPGCGSAKWLEYMVDKQGKKGWQWVPDSNEAGALTRVFF